MEPERQNDDDQKARWNGPSGQAWVDAQTLLDAMFKPFEDLLVAAVPAGAAEQVLDVGCGTGGTTLAAARRLGPQGRCTGIDLSEPMIAAARDRAQREGAPVSFISADAQTYPLEPSRFDLIMSRFGVMFFGDPVQAFANLRRAARDGAEFRFIAWRSAEDNPFMTTAERAAAHLLPNLPARRPNAPGQFAFADRARIHAILEESGWAGIDIRPIDVACTLPETGLDVYLTRMGPVAGVLREMDDRARSQVIETVRAAFAPYVHGADVRFTAACWMVAATAPKSDQSV